MKKNAAVLVSLGLFMGGCQAAGVHYDSKNFVDYYLIGRDYSTLNPLISMSGADLKVIANISDGMVETDRYGNLIGALAEDWTHSEDYKVWTFHLKDAVWATQNQEVYSAVTANDFVFGASYVLDPEMASAHASYFFMIDGAKEYYEQKMAGKDVDFSQVGIRAIDEKTVEYTLENPCPYLLSVLGSNGFYPVNETFVKQLDDPKSYGSTPENTLYSGAFVIESHQADSQLKLVKNENYWDKESVIFDTVTLLAIKDEESAYEYFMRGEMGNAPLVSTQVVTENKKENQYMLQKETGMLSYGLLFNNQTLYSEDVNLALSNEDFRQSVFYGFDRTMLTELINPVNPESILNQTFCPKGFVKTSDGRDYTTLGGLEKYQEGDLFQLAKALDYKEKAMKQLQSEGVGFPINLKIWGKSGDTSGLERLLMVKEILENNLGTDYITVEVKEYSTSFSAEPLKNGDYAIYIGGWNPDFADPINCLSVMKSDGRINNAFSPTQIGSSHFELPEFDALVEAADQIVDLDQRYEAFANAEAYLLDHAYFCPLYVSGGTYYVTTVNEYSRMHNLVGIDQFRYKGLEAYDHAINQEEYADFIETWEKGQ